MVVEKLISEHNCAMNSYLNFISSDFEVLMDPHIQDQSTLFDLTYNMGLKCEEYLSKYLFNKVDILIYSLDFGNFRKTVLAKHAESMKSLIVVYSRIIK